MSDHTSPSVCNPQENGEHHHRKKHKVKKLKKSPKRGDRDELGKKSRNDINDELDIAKKEKKDRDKETNKGHKKKMKPEKEFCFKGNEEKMKNSGDRKEEKHDESKAVCKAEIKMKRAERKREKRREKKEKWTNPFRVSSEEIASPNYLRHWKKIRWRTKKNKNFSSPYGITHGKFPNTEFSEDFLNNESRNQTIKDWKIYKKKNKNKGLVGVIEKYNESATRGHIYFDSDQPSQSKSIVSSVGNGLHRGHIHFDKDESSQFKNTMTTDSAYKSRHTENHCNARTPQHIYFARESPSRFNVIKWSGGSDYSDKTDKICSNNTRFKGKQTFCDKATSRLDESDNLIKPMHTRFDKDSPSPSNAEKSSKKKHIKHESNAKCKIHSLQHIHFDDDLISPSVIYENRFDNVNICDKSDIIKEKSRDNRLKDNCNRDIDDINCEIDVEIHNESKNCDNNREHVNALIRIEKGSAVRDAGDNDVSDYVNRLENDYDDRITNKSAVCDAIEDLSCKEEECLNDNISYSNALIDCDRLLKENNFSPVRKHIHFNDEIENTPLESRSECFKNEKRSKRKKHRKRKRERYEQSDESLKHDDYSDIEKYSTNRENRVCFDKISDIESNELKNMTSQSICDASQEISCNGNNGIHKKKKHREKICDTNSEIYRDNKIKKKNKHEDGICYIKTGVDSDEKQKSHKKRKKKKNREKKSTILEDVDSRERIHLSDEDCRSCESEINMYDDRYRSDAPDNIAENKPFAISNDSVYVSETDLGEASDPLCDSMISSASGKVWESAFNDSTILQGKNNRDIESHHKASSPQPITVHSDKPVEICAVPQWLVAGLPDYNNNQNLYFPKEIRDVAGNQRNNHTKFDNDMVPDLDPMFTPDVSESESESPRHLKKCRPALDTCKDSLCDIWNVLINQYRMLKDQAKQIDKVRGENRRHVKEKTELEDRVCELEILVKSLNKIIDEKDGEMFGLKRDFQYLQALIEDNHGISINRESLGEIQGRIADSVSMIDTLSSFLQSSTFKS